MADFGEAIWSAAAGFLSGKNLGQSNNANNLKELHQP